MPEANELKPQPWAWRMVVRGSFSRAWIEAGEAERRKVFDAWTGAHSAWQAIGCRLIFTMDDVLKTGQQPDGSSNFYTVWEIPDPSVVHELTAPFLHEEGAGAVKLSRYFALDIAIGKPIVSMENALGGPQPATPATAPGEFA
jgi:hypothetical protein